MLRSLIGYTAVCRSAFTTAVAIYSTPVSSSGSGGFSNSTTAEEEGSNEADINTLALADSLYGTGVGSSRLRSGDHMPSASHSLFASPRRSGVAVDVSGQQLHHHLQEAGEEALTPSGKKKMRVMTKARRIRLAAAASEAAERLSGASSPAMAAIHSQRVHQLKAEEELLKASLTRLRAERELAKARHECEGELNAFRNGLKERESVVAAALGTHASELMEGSGLMQNEAADASAAYDAAEIETGSAAADAFAVDAALDTVVPAAAAVAGVDEAGRKTVAPRRKGERGVRSAKTAREAVQALEDWEDGEEGKEEPESGGGGLFGRYGLRRIADVEVAAAEMVEASGEPLGMDATADAEAAARRHTNFVKGKNGGYRRHNNSKAKIKKKSSKAGKGRVGKAKVRAPRKAKERIKAAKAKEAASKIKAATKARTAKTKAVAKAKASKVKASKKVTLPKKKKPSTAAQKSKKASPVKKVRK